MSYEFKSLMSYLLIPITGKNTSWRTLNQIKWIGTSS